ncbi:hypothetical protein DFH09DRAFT_1097027 [Mycena vulgaris]|nr:hypothetical protein DFH09DRAFT_1097027 [Mycena vulgaris]
MTGEPVYVDLAQLSSEASGDWSMEDIRKLLSIEFILAERLHVQSVAARNLVAVADRRALLVYADRVPVVVSSWDVHAEAHQLDEVHLSIKRSAATGRQALSPWTRFKALLGRNSVNTVTERKGGQRRGRRTDTPSLQSPKQSVHAPRTSAPSAPVVNTEEEHRGARTDFNAGVSSFRPDSRPRLCAPGRALLEMVSRPLGDRGKRRREHARMRRACDAITMLLGGDLVVRGGRRE